VEAPLHATEASLDAVEALFDAAKTLLHAVETLFHAVKTLLNATDASLDALDVRAQFVANGAELAAKRIALVVKQQHHVRANLIPQVLKRRVQLPARRGRLRGELFGDEPALFVEMLLHGQDLAFQVRLERSQPDVNAFVGVLRHGSPPGGYVGNVE
jgi:hypothetical protein